MLGKIQDFIINSVMMILMFCALILAIDIAIIFTVAVFDNDCHSPRREFKHGRDFYTPFEGNSAKFVNVSILARDRYYVND